MLPNAVEALALSGELDAAAMLLERLARQAAAVESAWALASVDRSRGVLLLARGRADAAVSPLESAEAAFGRLGHRPDAARAVLTRGRALLRLGQRTQAADAFAGARGSFADMGAALWEARAAEELERAAPGRGSGELTPAEGRVAELVAQGMKNREVGQTLFMSVATVEAHLTRIYRKLGLRSRADLARLVAEGRLPDSSGSEPPSTVRRPGALANASPGSGNQRKRSNAGDSTGSRGLAAGAEVPASPRIVRASSR